MPPKIAYIMSRFPNLSETFILREMTELRQQGWTISVYPLIFQNQPVAHTEVQSWLGQVRKVPLNSPATFKAALTMTAHNLRAWVKVWREALWENRTDANLLIRAIILLPQAAQMACLMQQEGIQHIHAHYATHPALVAWIIQRLTGISYSVTVHAHDIFVRTAMLGPKLREAKFIAAISEYNRNHIAQLTGEWVRPKTHIIHCGIRPTDYVPRPETQQRGETFEILNIGSLQPYKGHPNLVEACAVLRQRGVPFRCRIIGAGEERQNLEMLIARLDLKEHVILLGPQPQETVANLLPTADCYVQPSIITPAGKMEGIPVALMEAMACGVPVIATAISGIPELVRPETTGWLVPPAAPTQLADAIQKIYAAPDQAAQLAKAGRELALAEFDLTQNVARLSTLLTNALAMTGSERLN
jgi:glycosyltransferase involved in cell wall biosynthesis